MRPTIEFCIDSQTFDKPVFIFCLFPLDVLPRDASSIRLICSFSSVDMKPMPFSDPNITCIKVAIIIAWFGWVWVFSRGVICAIIFSDRPV